VHAEPKLGPVLHPVTHLIPPGFPLLLLAPAVALDWFWSKTSDWPWWAVALASGTLFLATLGAVQWPFANFLMTPWARNPIFGAHYLDYYQGPNSYAARNLFYPGDATRLAFFAHLAMALAMAVATTAVGRGFGGWMRRVRR
jgi:hypothetical protein